MTARVLVPAGVSLVAIGALALAVSLHPSLGFRSVSRHPPGIRFCAAGATEDVLAPAALQCWMRAPHGLWRVHGYVSAHGALVVEATADDLRDADHIAQVVARSVGTRFSETLLYVRPELDSCTTTTVRLRWRGGGKPERLEF